MTAGLPDSAQCSLKVTHNFAHPSISTKVSLPQSVFGKLQRATHLFLQ